jgi:hypothetical protein
VSGCVFSIAAGVCIPTACNGVVQASCTGACAWDTGAGACVGATGFAHEYGNPPNDATVACALDVSLKTTITHNCGGAGTGGALNNCGVNAINENWPNQTGLHTPTSSNTLPLLETTNWAFSCASGNQLWLQASCGSCPGAGTAPAKHIFATWETTTGQIGFPVGCTTSCTSTGVAAGDAICASEAAAAGLTGTYHAWLSTTGVGGVNPTQLARQTENNGPYVLSNDAEVVANFTALIGNTGTAATKFKSGIGASACDGQSVDVRGVFEACTAGFAPAAHAWTGTKDNGTAAATNCTNWTVGTSAANGEEGNSGLGNNSTGWSQAGSVSCATVNSLYCIEQ